MADAGVARDANRLPWLEPYRAPPRKKSNHRVGVIAAIGVAGLAGAVALLNRDMIPMPAEEAVPRVEMVLPARVDWQPTIVLPELRSKPGQVEKASAEPAPTPRRPSPAKRKITAAPARVTHGEVAREQSADEATKPVAIAALPPPPDPPRPAVNPAAQVAPGKTVQLGIFRSRQQAEVAWRSAIRDYTYLVTLPKSIQPISISSKRFYRLQLGTPSKNHARQLCSNLRSIGRSCTVA